MDTKHKIRVGVVLEFAIDLSKGLDKLTIAQNAKAYVESGLLDNVPEGMVYKVYALEVDGKQVSVEALR
jgi:hypothetical protein